MQAALCELEHAGNAADQRVSTSETEAPKMKHRDGSYAPSRNVQLSTDSKAGVIVGVRVTTAHNDVGQLEPALEQIEKNCGRKPKIMLADNGYASRQNVEALSNQGIELVAPWKNEKSRQAGVSATHGIAAEFTPAAFSWDEQAGVFRGGPRKLRRSVVAETPHMRIKENWGWRRFSVRGLAKSAKEAIWVAIAYNIHVWTRLRWTARATNA